jgi:hypothetical protein
MVELKPKGVSGAVRRGAGGAVAETLKRTGSAARGATSAVSGVSGIDAVADVGEQVQEAVRGAGGAVERATGGGEHRTVREELREIVREAALEVLVPVARRATREAAKYALRRGPQVARDTVPKLAGTLGAAIEEAGGPGAFAKDALSSVSRARGGMLKKVDIGGGSRSRPWRERRLPVEESIDVVVPLATAYAWFTEFEEYAKFMSRGETVDERLNERITWKRTDGVDATAVITFHRLSDRLTRVMVTYDDEPRGVLEKTTSLLSTSRRGLRADLMRFKAFVEMSEEGTEEERRRTHGRGGEEEYAEEYETAEEEGGDGEYEEEGPEGEYEEEGPPVPSRPVRRRPAARRSQQKARRR